MSDQFQPITPSTLPRALTQSTNWLVWRLVKTEHDKKPRKIPYYCNGKLRSKDIDQGSAQDREQLTSFEIASRTASIDGQGRAYAGIGFAPTEDIGIVMLDFDDCVIDGVIKPEVAALIEGTYAEFSPSGSGIHAFFFGSIPQDKKDHNTSGKHAFAVEFFHRKGYFTVTGNRTPDCAFFDHDIAPITPMAEALYRERFKSHPGVMVAGRSTSDVDVSLDGAAAFEAWGTEQAAADNLDWFASLTAKVGISLEKARKLLSALDPNCGYQEWLNTGASLHHEFDGSPEALQAWCEWSKGELTGESCEKYPGDKALQAKWKSFGSYSGAPITAAYLLRHAKDANSAAKYEAAADWKERIGEVATEMELRETLCPQIAKDTRLTDVEREALAQRLLDAFKKLGTKLTIAFCRKLISPPERQVPTVKQKRPLTEFGNTDRMLDRYADSLMYVPETDSWYCWTGVYWRKSTTTDVEFYAKETIKALVLEASDHEADLGEFFDFCRMSQQAKMVRNMVALASSDPRVMVPASELDKHSGMLCVQNGVVNLKTGELLAPDPAYRMTRVCACEYKAEARAPLFLKVLHDVFFDDRELVEFFLRLMGYALVGDPVEDIMVIPYGNGSNGKSTVFRTIQKVIGSYARTADASTFVSDGGQRNSGGPREDIVRLQGSRFVYVAEPDEGAELREGAIKGMTGGDAITARAMFARTSIEVEPTWVPIMPTNHKPVVKGNDNGIWRRLVLIPFLRNFETDDKIVKDPKLAEKLRLEAEGVLALLVSAAGAYLATGLKQPASIKKAREDYRSQMDILAEWLEERCELQEGAHETMKRLWLSWEAFARDRGALRFVSSSIALGKRLDNRFPSGKVEGSRVRFGLRLKTIEAEGSFNDDDWSQGFFQS